jgi:Cysteine-rich CWC
MLRKLFTFIPVLNRPQTCEACGNSFACEIASIRGCWCADIKLSEQTRSELRTRYKGCLCRSCLEKEESKHCSAGEGSEQLQ